MFQIKDTFIYLSEMDIFMEESKPVWVQNPSNAVPARNYEKNRQPLLPSSEKAERGSPTRKRLPGEFEAAQKLKLTLSDKTQKSLIPAKRGPCTETSCSTVQTSKSSGNTIQKLAAYTISIVSQKMQAY